MTKDMSERLARFAMPIEKQRGGITGPKSEAIAELIIALGEAETLDEEKELENRVPGAGKEAKRARMSLRMKYWLGRLRTLWPGEIRAMVSEARHGKNPGALFNWLLKQKLEKRPIGNVGQKKNARKLPPPPDRPKDSDIIRNEPNGNLFDL